MIVVDGLIHHEMLEHLAQAAPDEGCGLLAGVKSNIQVICDTWVPMVNVAEFPRFRYEMDPDALVEAWQRLEDDGRRPWIVCHSHVRDAAMPSTHDVRLAVDPTLHHLVVSLAHPTPYPVLWEINGFTGLSTKIRYRVVDLGFQGKSATDLTHGVSGG